MIDKISAILSLKCFIAFIMMLSAACASENIVQSQTKELLSKNEHEKDRNMVNYSSNLPGGTHVLDLNHLQDFDAIVPKLAAKRVVFVGETHDQYSHHLNQLEIIRRLHKIHPDLVIGMEFFQQPFQQYVDDYIAGKSNEKEFLKGTEYYARWGFDYRLYRPILDYAREQRIPVIALNVPKEITSKVGKAGIVGLTAAERAKIPQEIDRSDASHRELIKKVFEQHPNQEERNFERFLEVQLVWDEGMAERAAQYLEAHPDRHMVILAGSGHVVYGSGIPQRLARRLDEDMAIIINGADAGIKPGIADFILFPEHVELPPMGRLGIYMKDTPHGVTVGDFTNDSAARERGIEKGDWLVSVDGEAIESSADVKLALMGKSPGESVQVQVRRDQSAADKKKEEFVFKVDLR